MASLWFETDVISRHKCALEFDHVSLQGWGLSNRTLNALLSYDFKMTVGDVIRAGESLSVKGLGDAGLEELNTKISQLLEEARNIKIQPPVDQSSAPSNSEASGDPLLKIFPQSAQSAPLVQLHLDAKTHGALVKAGIASIGDLYNANTARLSDIQGFHPGSLGNLNGSLISLLNSTNQGGDVDWFQYWKAQGIQILPLTSTSSTSQEQVIRDIPKIIEEILRREYDERSWLIIQRRFGLGKAGKLTLEDMGNVFGLSRERIRQLEEKALRVLGKVLVEQQYAGKNYQVHPFMHQAVGIAREIILAEPNHLILETKLLERLHQRLIIDIEKAKSSLYLILSLIRAERILPYYPNAVPIWGYIDRTQHTMLESGTKRLDDFLTRETILPQHEIDILVQLNKGVKKSEKLTLAQLSGLINLCSSIERRDDGSVWGKFEYLKGRANQVERILVESGSPMSITDIARIMSHRLVPLGQHKIAEATLSNQINSDDRFVHIGRSGKWGLKSWSHIDTKSVLTLMEECLIARNKPATIDEIYAYVSERRPVSKQSIITYLLMEKETFARIGRNTWGLTRWSDATNAQTWNMEQVADFVANIFKIHKVRELDYKVIKEALMKEAGVSAKQAQGLLNYNPVIKTRRGTKWDQLLAVFQPNYRDMLAQAKTNFSRRAGLRQQVEQSAHNILKATPDKQMPMTELIRSLQRQFDCSETTLYQYVGKMASIDRIDAPTSHTKICRLKDTHISVSSSGTLRQRISESARGILEAAPNKQISLAELIMRLRKNYDCPKATLYQYLANLDYVERLDVPGSRVKLLRMKGTQGTELFPQVKNITNPTLREKVERVLPFLTEENVDIGLFLLSKEFEATLKTYLIKASTNSKLSVLPQGKTPDKWNLIGMVECAKENGIITDHATFHYLRQARNERAHGTMPSLLERQTLMGSIQYIAGLYIGYIKLLDDLTQNL